MLETKNETSVPVVRVPLMNVTVRIPLARVAVAAGLPLKPANDETAKL